MKKILTFYTIPILLILVVFFQLYNSNYNRLTPWKGGGFGMFSTNKEFVTNAIGYIGKDSILIKVKSNKLNIPISDNFLQTTLHFPSQKRLELLSKKILHSYLKPENYNINKNYIDKKSFNIVDQNKDFYEKIYLPTFYKNDISAKKDGAFKIDKIKILLYEVDFYEKNYTFNKTLINQFISSN